MSVASLLSAALLFAAPPGGDLPVLEADPPPAPAPPSPPGRVTFESVPAPPVCGPMIHEAAGPFGPTFGPHPHRHHRPHGSEIGPPYHYDRAFRPPPLGRLMHDATNAQICNGESQLAVLRRTDFLAGTAELSPHGLRRLAFIAGRLPVTADPVLIEPPARWEPAGAVLAEARRARVAGLLATGPFPVPPERVVLAPDPADGLAATDAELVYRNLLILTGSGGKLRTRFDVFGSAAQQATGSAGQPPTAAGAPR